MTSLSFNRHRDLPVGSRSGTVMGICEWARFFSQRPAWLSGDGVRPLLGSLGPKDAKFASGNEMALEVEGVVDGGMDGQEALSEARRFAPRQLPFAQPDRQMRIPCEIVSSPSLFVPRTQADVPESRRVGPQLVGHNNGWGKPLCPSLGKMGQPGLFSNGGSGSSWLVAALGEKAFDLAQQQQIPNVHHGESNDLRRGSGMEFSSTEVAHSSSPP